MAVGCNGLCIEERSAQGINYDDGWKRCSICFKKIMTRDPRCYCCHYPLRSGPRKTKFKKEPKRL